jgi:mannitol-1-/sugar-/sorbitol-6-phosphatase
MRGDGGPSAPFPGMRPRKLRCAAVLFDLDGVLVDSVALVERLWREWAADHGIEPDSVLAAAHGWRSLDTIRTVAPHLDVEREATELEAREVRESDGVTEQPGARRLLEQIPADRWGVVTSGTRELASARFAATRLPLPGVLVTADDVFRGKPDPEGYLRGAALLGIPPGDLVVVEDAPAGIDAAIGAGTRVVAVAGTHPREDLRGADVCVASLGEVHVEGPRRADDLILSIDAMS